MTTEGLYFLGIEIEDVSCFKAVQRLDLSDGEGRPARWTVLLGENGTGKTTLLRCLASIFMDRPVAGGRAYRSWRPGGSGTAGPILSSVTFGSSLTGSFCPSRTARRDWSAFGCTGRTPSHARDALILGYGALRRMSAPNLSTSPPLPLESLLDDDRSLRNAEEWLLRLDYQSLTEARAGGAQRLLDQVRATLVRLLPDVESIEIALPSEAPSTSLAGLVRFQTPYGTVGLADLSLGYQTMIGWIVDLAAQLFEKYPELPDPLTGPAVALIDEIDLHLHPRWQRDLIDHLSKQFPNVQFIATAHSPLFVQAAEGANLAVLRREGDHVVIENDPGVVRGWRLDQLVTSGLFGLSSARAPQIAARLDERMTILSKPSLDAADERRIAEIEAELGPLPVHEDTNVDKDIVLIQQFAAALRSGSPPTS